MVTQHFRWDFIGLSTDNKPTPATSSRVVDGSTFYCADNSKLYVYCGDQWYEKTATGGGGGDAGLFLVRASETTSKSQTPEGSDLQQYAGQTGLYINDAYLNPDVPGVGNIYYVYSIGVDPETEDPYAEYTLIANMQEAWTAISNISNMMPLAGFGAPDSSTSGQAGQLYIDAQNYVLYVCIEDSDPYVWHQLGGSGVTISQINDLIDAINTATSSNISHIGS